MMRFIFSIGLLLQSLSAFVQSEYYNFSKLNIYNGLSHNQVNTILKGADGFLWFGTSSGLNRYDGYSCRVFRKNYGDSSSLMDNNVLSLYELPNGNMWVSTGGGTCIYNSRTEKFDPDFNSYLQSIGLPQWGLIKIMRGNGRYWFLYDNADLYLYSETNKKAKNFKQGSGLNNAEKIISIKETKDGKLWLLYEDGFLQQYDLNLNKVIFSSAEFKKLNIASSSFNFFIDNDGDVWLWGFSNGVFLFQPQHNSIRQFNENSFPSRLNTNLVSQIVQDNKGIIWVATDHGGINLIDKKNNFNT